MKKPAKPILILVSVVLCTLSAAAGFFFSPNILSGRPALKVTVSEDPVEREDVSDRKAGYEIPPRPAAETEPESGQWKQNEAGQYTYENPDGSLAKEWQQIDGPWYYFNDNGIMQTGWMELEGAWYYLDASGEMMTGWIKDNGSWYYMDPSGKMAVNYYTPDGFYVDSFGKLAVDPNWGD